MFLQNFVAEFDYYYPNFGTGYASVTLTASEQYAYPMTKVGKFSQYTESPSDVPIFPNVIKTPYTLPLQVSSDLVVTATGSLGYQGMAQFMVNLNSTWLAWSANCTQTNGSACSEPPYSAKPYFNDLDQFTSLGQSNDLIAGYNVSCAEISQAACLNTEGDCSGAPQSFCVADEIMGDLWRQDGNAYSGVMGFGKDSPVWGIVTGAQKEFYVECSNFTDFSSFAQSDYAPKTTASQIILGL